MNNARAYALRLSNRHINREIAKVHRVPTQSQYLEFTLTSYLYVRRVVPEELHFARSFPGHFLTRESNWSDPQLTVAQMQPFRSVQRRRGQS